MDLITEQLTARNDFEELLNDYQRFELTIEELLEKI